MIANCSPSPIYSIHRSTATTVSTAFTTSRREYAKQNIAQTEMSSRFNRNTDTGRDVDVDTGNDDNFDRIRGSTSTRSRSLSWTTFRMDPWISIGITLGTLVIVAVVVFAVWKRKSCMRYMRTRRRRTSASGGKEGAVDPYYGARGGAATMHSLTRPEAAARR